MSWIQNSSGNRREKYTPKVKTPVKVLLAIAYMWLLWDGMLYPIYALFAEGVGGDILETAGAIAIFYFVSGILHLLFGKIANSIHAAKQVMLGGYILATLTTFGYLAVTDTTGLFITQVLLGIANAMSSSTWDGMYSRNIKQKDTVFMWSLVEGGYAITTAIAAVLGGIVVTMFSFEVLFIVMGLTMALASAAIFFIQEVSPEDSGLRDYGMRKRA